MTTAPYDHALNLTTQATLTFASWFIALALLAVSALLGWRQRTAFPVLLVLSAGIAALAEPLYDVGFKLLFFIPGQWTLFNYGGIPQPVWTISGYVVLYAGPALFICQGLERGMSRHTFYGWTLVTWLASSVFEIYGIAGGAYAYWGAHALRVFGYPLAVGVLETTFVLLFSVVAHEYRTRISGGWGQLGLLVAFPVTFYGVNFGIGAPMLVALGLASPSPTISVVGAIATIGIAAGLLFILAEYIATPHQRSAGASVYRSPMPGNPLRFGRSS